MWLSGIPKPERADLEEQAQLQAPVVLQVGVLVEALVHGLHPGAYTPG